MIYIIINGILIESETVVQAHFHATIKYRKSNKITHENQIQDDSDALAIIREVLNKTMK